MNKNNNQSGFTLVELMAVIVIIGLIGAMLFGNIFSSAKGSKAKLNESKMVKLIQSINNYKLQYNNYPQSLQDLVKGGANMSQSTVFTPLAKEDELNDIWGRPYTYRSEGNGRGFSLMSYGADGAPGGEGANQDVIKTP